MMGCTHTHPLLRGPGPDKPAAQTWACLCSLVPKICSHSCSVSQIDPSGCRKATCSALTATDICHIHVQGDPWARAKRRGGSLAQSTEAERVPSPPGGLTGRE